MDQVYTRGGYFDRGQNRGQQNRGQNGGGQRNYSTPLRKDSARSTLGNAVENALVNGQLSPKEIHQTANRAITHIQKLASQGGGRGQGGEWTE